MNPLIVFLLFRFIVVPQPSPAWLPVTDYDVARTVTFYGYTPKSPILSAHSNLAGEAFYALELGDAIELGRDGYTVTRISRYRISEGIWIDESGVGLLEYAVIFGMVKPKDRLFLFTCWEVGGDPKGGRLVVEAAR